jgi:endonuclease YncB( thermonuclease family)
MHRRRRSAAAWLFLFVLVAASAALSFVDSPSGEPLSGPARVIDGDGLRIDGVVIRLRDIDALELRQTCRRYGTDWGCGEEAARALKRLVGGRKVSCRVLGFDTYGRSLARCRLPDGEDIAAAQVRGGWAFATSLRYARAEFAARSDERGAWTSGFVRPKAWRRSHGR